jgi:hypothetical protein
MFGWRLISEDEYSMAQALMRDYSDREFEMIRKTHRYVMTIGAFLVKYPDLSPEYIQITTQMEADYNARIQTGS